MRKLLCVAFCALILSSGAVYAVPTAVGTLAEWIAINSDQNGDYVLTSDIDASNVHDYPEKDGFLTKTGYVNITRTTKSGHVSVAYDDGWMDWVVTRVDGDVFDSPTEITIDGTLYAVTFAIDGNTLITTCTTTKTNVDYSAYGSTGLVEWVSGDTFLASWEGSEGYLVVGNKRYTISTITNSTNLVVSAWAESVSNAKYYFGTGLAQLTLTETGHIDGAGHRIDGIFMNGAYSYGVFSAMKGTLEKLGITNICLYGTFYLAPISYSASASAIVSEVFVTGKVVATDTWSGGSNSGFMHYTQATQTGGGKVENCYTRVTIVASAGAVAGFASTASNGVTKCYAANTITAPGTKRGFSATTTKTLCHWDKTTSGISTSETGATGLTTSEAKDSANYTDWDFTNIWAIDGTGAINDGYPYLRNVLPSSSGGGTTKKKKPQVIWWN